MQGGKIQDWKCPERYDATVIQGQSETAPCLTGGRKLFNRFPMIQALLCSDFETNHQYQR